MKTRLLAIAMLLCTFAAKAQYVTIPDPAFALFLQQTYPNCMNGNQMDTTCSEIVNEITVNCSHANIGNLAGIQYFDNLQQLECSHNNLTAIPDLYQPNFTSLSCDGNVLTTLPALSSTTYIISCQYNQIASISSLPAALWRINCGDNAITSLPSLPTGLEYLQVNNNALTSLPTLPTNLKELNVAYNGFSTLPNLPAGLTFLMCDSNYLQSLPTLPNSLQVLYMNMNNFSALPSLPNGLLTLQCAHNPLFNLGQLPNTLIELNCEATSISVLPALPPNLEWLDCGSNNLTNLPSIPVTVKSVMCAFNSLTTLPALPTNLLYLSCSHNNLTSIPALPRIVDLNCSNNPLLTDIGTLRDTIASLYCGNCPLLNCLPAIKRAFTVDFSNTGITCITHYFTTAFGSTPPVANFPICLPGNLNGCPAVANIVGRTYTDKNNNCTFDGNDQGQYGLKHTLNANGIVQQQTYSNSAGNYSFDVTAFDNYETRLDTTGLPFTIACPTSGLYYDTLTVNDSTHFNRDFALQCEAGFDLAARSVASAMVFRPANNTVVDIHAGDLANFYSASCAQGVSGVVTVTLNGPITYVSPAPGAVAPSNVTNNVLTWNVADFGTADALHDFNIIIHTDTFAQSGQQACFDVKVTPLTGDNDTSNNHLYFCFDIVNSYDPNDKTAYPSGNIDTTQEWLTYRVRFQNTGTAEAQHIYIMDTLDANVKVETFQLLSYSHQPNVQINENIIRFNFPFINLPDSTSDEPGSHGYVQYKVKLKEDLAIGTAINNTAYIYFDFNPPVVTNTATNTIAVEADTLEVGIKPISKNFDLLVYPNPANQQVTVTTSTTTKTLTIYDLTGRVRLIQNMNGTSATVNISDLPSGVYFVGASTSNVRKRLIKLQ